MKSLKPGTTLVSPILFHSMLAIGAFIFVSNSTAWGQSIGNSQSPAITSNLQSMYESKKREHSQINDRHKAIMARYEQVQMNRETLFDAQQEAGVTRESFGELMKTLQSQKIQLMIDLAGLEAKLDALKEAQSSTPEGNTEVLELLKRKFDLARQQHLRLKQLHSKGTVSNADVTKSEMEVLVVELEMAQAKKPTSNPVFSKELLAISLERTEKQARLIKTEELLAKISSSRNLLIDEERLVRSSEFLSTKLEESSSYKMDLEIELETLKKELEEFGGSKRD